MHAPRVASPKRYTHMHAIKPFTHTWCPFILRRACSCSCNNCTRQMARTKKVCPRLFAYICRSETRALCLLAVTICCHPLVWDFQVPVWCIHMCTQSPSECVRECEHASIRAAQAQDRAQTPCTQQSRALTPCSFDIRACPQNHDPEPSRPALSMYVLFRCVCYLDAQARLIGAHLDAHALVHIRAGPKNAGTLGPTPHSTPYRALPQENFERRSIEHVTCVATAAGSRTVTQPWHVNIYVSITMRPRKPLGFDANSCSYFPRDLRYVHPVVVTRQDLGSTRSAWTYQTAILGYGNSRL
jgi:hypothetical protein